MTAIYGWIPGGLATILMIYALFITIRAANMLAGELKSAIYLLWGSLLVYWSMGIAVGALLTIGVSTTHWFWWTGIPTIALIGSILFVFGATKLFKTLEGVLSGKRLKR